MENNNNSIYQELFREYKLHEIYSSGTKCQENFNNMWRENKRRLNNNKTEFDKWAQEKILEYKQKTCVKKSSSILSFFSHRGADVRV